MKFEHRKPSWFTPIIPLLISVALVGCTRQAPRQPDKPEIKIAPANKLLRVVGVHDGDTITVIDSSKVQFKIRLGGIDAPELDMDFGQRSKKNLSDLIYGREVNILSNKSDRYGRLVGIVYLNQLDINLEQLKAGLAWHYKKYESEQTPQDRRLYAAAEAGAREKHLGIWSVPNPSEPWDHRAQKKILR